MSSVIDSTRPEHLGAPVATVLSERWSPRAFDATAALTDESLHALLEAARWAPSAFNGQPWHFLVAMRGSAAFDRIIAHMTGANPVWTPAASALVLNIATTAHEDGSPYPSAVYDLSQAVAHMTIEAEALGLHAHQMMGFDRAGMRTEFAIPITMTPVSLTAIGTLGTPDSLPDGLAQRERSVRTRKPVSEILYPID